MNVNTLRTLIETDLAIAIALGWHVAPVDPAHSTVLYGGMQKFFLAIYDHESVLVHQAYYSKVDLHEALGHVWRLRLMPRWSSDTYLALSLLLPGQVTLWTDDEYIYASRSDRRMADIHEDYVRGETAAEAMARLFLMEVKG